MISCKCEISLVIFGIASSVGWSIKPGQPARGPSSACSQGPKVAAEIPRSPAHQALLAEFDHFLDILYSPALLPVVVLGKENEER